MEFVHEVTAYLENKPGRLAKICSALAQEKVDIRALSVMETDGPSVLRFITTDLETTKNVLTSLGTEFRIAEVLAVQIENRTGSLARVLEKLAEEHINVEYAYASTHRGAGQGARDLSHLEPQARLSDLERGRELRLGCRAFGGPTSLALAVEPGPHVAFERLAAKSLASETISSVKKKKVRVALRKNRQNRTRANDLTRQFRDDELTPAAEPAVDRIRPKGELSRHRTIIEEVAREKEPDCDERRLRTPPPGGPSIPPTCLRGRVVRVHGLVSMVRCRRRSDLFLPCPPPAQDPGDRGPERRHGRRPCLVPAGVGRRRRRADREGRDPARRDHPRLSPSSAHHRGQRRPGAHRLGPGRARPEARADRPLPGLGRDGRRPRRDRPQQGRPGRPGRSASG